MAGKAIKYYPEVDILEHEDTSAPETKRVLLYGWDETGLQKVRLAVDGSGNLQVEPLTGGVSDETSSIYSGTSALTPKFAKANVAAAQTDASIVAAVTNKKIRVLSFRLHVGGTATNVTFNTKPAGAGTAISELFACADNGGRAEAYSPIGHFQTAAGEGLTVTTGSGSTVGVGVVYVEV